MKGRIIERLEMWVVRAISGTVVDWFRSYLTCQDYFVSLGEFCSGRTIISRGFPQGSLLGTLCFLSVHGAIRLYHLQT